MRTLYGHGDAAVAVTCRCGAILYGQLASLNTVIDARHSGDGHRIVRAGLLHPDDAVDAIIAALGPTED